MVTNWKKKLKYYYCFSSNAYKCLCIYLFGGYANPRAPRPRDPLPHMLSYPYQPLRICIDYDLGGRVIPVGTLSGPLLDQDTIEQLWKEDRLKWLAAAWVWRGVLIMDLKLDLPPPPEGILFLFFFLFFCVLCFVNTFQYI